MAIAINERVPHLESGDHLTRDEFLRRQTPMDFGVRRSFLVCGSTATRFWRET